MEKVINEVFILGAGSSFGYGLPLGSGLKYLIENFDVFIGYYNGLKSPPGDEDMPIISPTINRHPKRKELKESLKHTNFDLLEVAAGKMIEISVSSGFFTVDELEEFLKLFKASESSTIDAFISAVSKRSEPIRGTNFTDGDLYQKIGKILIGFFISSLQKHHLPSGGTVIIGYSTS